VNPTMKTVLFWAVILVSATFLWQTVKNANSPTAGTAEISYSEFLSQVNSGNVTKVRIAGKKASGTYRDGSSFRVTVPASQDQILVALQQKGVETWYSDSEQQSTTGWLMNLAPLALLAVLWFFMIRQMRPRATQERNPSTSNAPWPSS
jgi:cell division protease FtsH